MVKWPNRRPDSDGDSDGGPETADATPGPSVAATDTGDATARDGATAVSGYTGPGPETAGPVHVSGTGVEAIVAEVLTRQYLTRQRQTVTAVYREIARQRQAVACGFPRGER